jgi:uncharacterized repeat protein (TIGR01451 family)
VRRPGNVTSYCLPRLAIAVSLATAVSIAPLPGAVAAADTYKADFEAPLFHPGTVNEQDGWKSAKPGDIPSLPHGYDQEVHVNAGTPPLFGGQSLRLSNGYNQFQAGPPEFHYQTYSKPTKDAAGESLTDTEYTAQFSFISAKPTVEQPGLHVSVSPDEGEGGRMSYIGLEDTPAGIDVEFYDTPEPDGEFVGYDLGTVPRDTPHTIKFWMELNPGPDNDLVRIYIDGHDAGQCFTTWENFYRAVSQPVPASDTLEYRSTGEQENLSLIGGGFLFDNETITTGNGPGPPGCDTVVEKEADKHTVSVGGRVGYRITIRNRGRLSTRSVQVCDRIPRLMTFVSADRKLRHLLHRHCLVIPRLAPGQSISFHIVLRVDADAPPGTVPNIADETSGVKPVAPPPATLLGLPGKTAPAQPPAKKDKATVRVKAKHTGRRRPPPFTG